jgi:hypothetical protein
MRKIISGEDARRKEKRNRIVVSILLLSIMVLSVFGIIIDSIGNKKEDSNKLIYKGVEFLKGQERWFFSKGGANFSILNSPENVTDISIPENINLLTSYFQIPLYVSSNDNSLEAEIYYNFENIANRIQPGCLNGTFCEGDFPTKTCEDNFILILESNETSITQEQNCVIIKAKGTQEMQRALDAFFLKITGVN